MIDVAVLDDYLHERTAADEFAGVVRIDVDRSDGTTDVLMERGYGYASRAWQVPCAPDIRFDTASVTKLFTAVAALQQVDAGAFALDTPVMEYLGFSGTQIPAGVTPYHLLTHTSGIADDADEEAGERYEDLFVDRPNYAFRHTIDILPNFIHKTPNFPPGEGTRYCNVSYVLLGLMIERATSMTYRDYVAENVFERAGMAGALFASSDIVTPLIAEGADPVRDDLGRVSRWQRNVFSYPPTGSPDGGAHVTAGDLVAFHQALRSGRLLSQELTAQMLTPHEILRTKPGGTHRTGFGFEFWIDADGGRACYWKEGMNVGASAVLRYYPSSQVTLVVLSNMEDGAWEPIHRVDDMLGVAHAGLD
jgi:CubicO group peptidase (beta-lactamase class C family)